jgi:hypothetical protein
MLLDLSAADGVNDFDLVARLEIACLMCARGHDLAIHFKRQALSGQTHHLDKAGCRNAIRQRPLLSI